MAQHASCLRPLACSKEAPSEDPIDRTRALGARGSCIELHMSLRSNPYEGLYIFRSARKFRDGVGRGRTRRRCRNPEPRRRGISIVTRTKIQVIAFGGP